MRHSKFPRDIVSILGDPVLITLGDGHRPCHKSKSMMTKVGDMLVSLPGNMGVPEVVPDGPLKWCEHGCVCVTSVALGTVSDTPSKSPELVLFRWGFGLEGPVLLQFKGYSVCYAQTELTFPCLPPSLVTMLKLQHYPGNSKGTLSWC